MVKNWQTLVAWWVGTLSCNKKKSRSRTQLDEPIKCASGGDPLLLYKILHLLFFPVVLCALWLESRKKVIKMVLMWNLWNFNFFGRGDVSPTYSELCRFVSASEAKHQVSSPIIILLKKFLSASAIAIMSWQDVTRSSLCSGVKECGTKRTHNFLFPKSSFRIWGCLKILLSFLMRFNGHL